MKSLVCIDAGLLVRSLLPHAETDKAVARLAAWEQDGVEMIAPAILAFEVTAILRRAVMSKEIPRTAGEKAFLRFRQIEIHLSHHPRVFALAWDLAKQFDRPRLYEATYLALAQLHNCDFWTADRTLYETVSAHLPWVHWLGNFTPGEPNDATGA